MVRQRLRPEDFGRVERDKPTAILRQRALNQPGRDDHDCGEDRALHRRSILPANARPLLQSPRDPSSIRSARGRRRAVACCRRLDGGAVRARRRSTNHATAANSASGNSAGRRPNPCAGVKGRASHGSFHDVGRVFGQAGRSGRRHLRQYLFGLSQGHRPQRRDVQGSLERRHRVGHVSGNRRGRCRKTTPIASVLTNARR